MKITHLAGISGTERMKSSFNFCLIAVAGFLSLQVDANSDIPVPFTLSVSSPPPEFEDDSNFTIVRTSSGEYQRIAQEDAQNDTSSDFVIERDVRFELFTPSNPTEPQFLTLDNYTTVKSSNFNWWYPTRILIHGWYSEGLLTPRFADAYFTKKKYNVNFIAVNWQKGSDIYNYFTARGRVKAIAEHVAKFVDFMSKKAWLKIEDLTIVGHSLGAHIAGIAGKKINRGKVGKIVGLDPASPWFNYKDVNERLTETDASYVEVIHTCAGTLGFSQPIGMASFYPNGGSSQPGCKLDVVGACAHGRAYEYYIKSIVRPEFFAFQCESFKNLQLGNCSVMNQVVQMGGEPGIKKAQGIFYLLTNPVPDYSQGRYGVVKAIANSKEHPYKKMALAGWLKTKNFIKQGLGVDTSPNASYSDILKQILIHWFDGDYSPGI